MTMFGAGDAMLVLWLLERAAQPLFFPLGATLMFAGVGILIMVRWFWPQALATES